jgi:HPt (histidine-containing phosphotransfer) domain-containing protein
MSTGKNIDLLAPVMDAQAALRRLGDDAELLDQIIQIFLEDAPGLIHAACEALARGDAGELRRAAHSLKGMMATLSAQPGVQAAFRLEQCASHGDLGAASPLIHGCGERVSELTAVLQSYCDSGESAGSPTSSSPARS